MMSSKNAASKLMENTFISRDSGIAMGGKRKLALVDPVSNKKAILCTPVDRDLAPTAVGYRNQLVAPVGGENRPIYSIASPSLPPNVIDIDDSGARNAKYNPAYARVLYKNKFQIEQSLVIPSPVFGRFQQYITKNMYAILCNYLSEVCSDNLLQTSTFVSTMHLLDRVLAVQPVMLSNFQMVGCACLLLASKLEDIYPPTADSIVKTCGNSFDKPQLFRAEADILRWLDYKIFVPTRFEFGQRFGVAGGLSAREQSLVHYLLEISFLDFDLNAHTHSKVAAAAVHLTFQMMRPLDDELWNATMRHYTGLEEDDLVAPVMSLAQLRYSVEASKMKNVVHKYGGEEHHCVADLMAINPKDVRFDCRVGAQTSTVGALSRLSATGSETNLTRYLTIS